MFSEIQRLIFRSSRFALEHLQLVCVVKPEVTWEPERFQSGRLIYDKVIPNTFVKPKAFCDLFCVYVAQSWRRIK